MSADRFACGGYCVMSGFGDLPDDGSEWVEVSPHLTGTGGNSPHSRHPGVVMHTTDLSMLCSALEEHIKKSPAPSHFGFPSEFTPELHRSQFGEWPSRPDISGTCSLLLSTGANSSGPCSSDLTPPNSPVACFGGADVTTLAPERPWRLRHSRFFQWRFVDWLLHNFPSLFRHFASFLLGAAAMLVLLKKRGKLPPLGRLPLE